MALGLRMQKSKNYLAQRELSLEECFIKNQFYYFDHLYAVSDLKYTISVENKKGQSSEEMTSQSHLVCI